MIRAIGKYLGDFVAIVALVVLGVGVGSYILLNQDARPTIPLIEDSPIVINADFSDAQAVVPGQGQSVRVSGVQIGKIGGVKLVNGVAVVEMDLEGKYQDLVHQDATALLRPRTGLKDMFVELDPGSPTEPVIPEGGHIPVQNTAPDIDPDELFAALDTDTRDYLKLLISGAGKGLRNNGDDAREVLRRLAPLHRDLAELQGAVAARRAALEDLVTTYGRLTDRLGQNDEDLTRFVTASNDALGALASQDGKISEAVGLLPGTLRTTQSTLIKADRLGELLGPTFDDLRPAVRSLDEANDDLIPLARDGAPAIKNRIRPFVRKARPLVDDLRPAARDLAQSTPDLRIAFAELNRFFNMLAFNPADSGEGNKVDPDIGNDEDVQSNARDEGYFYWLDWVLNNTVSLFSTSDAQGPIRRFQFSLGCNSLAEVLSPILAPGSGIPPEIQTLLGFTGLQLIAGCET